MENMYGVGVTNRYDLFLEEEVDPLELLQSKEQEKELRKKSKVAEKENKGKPEAKPKTAANVPRKGIKETPNNKTQEIKAREDKAKPLTKINPERNERVPKVAGANREERNNRRNREDRPYNPPGDREDRPPRREFGDRDVERNRALGPRGGRGGRGGGRFNDGRGKREFDRQSGSDKTGIKPVDKREGGGAHNWGTHKDDIADLNKSGQSETDPFLENDKADGAPASENAVTENATEPETEGDKPAPVEEEPKELTLDEWKAQKAALRQKPSYNLRKAGEGEDLSQWKKMYALDKKKEGEEAETDEELEYDAADYPQRVGRQKHILEIEFTFNDARRGGGGGRGRGRGRGNMGGRADRPPRPFKNDDVVVDAVDAHPVDRESTYGGRGRQNAPKVDDEHDFPSLG
ncbi:plasminogen activator inhibitor 1 RNA-binding protein [Ctenocephalides felis]|uniref:plasminogen activator inhibitor 1 RNA-binding protein n=1 Tax=Ctenocephalides felis TaxID=7515 RepID=UPI000E6E3E50|nr:plasminogen activator inhibitor 1 RNA-binding protein [Ctenocephalides felis]